MSSHVVELPEKIRGELKDPLGPIYTDPTALLADATTPIITVGDMVTYHLLAAGRRPDVAFIDTMTKRSPVDQEILDAIDGFDHQFSVVNPPAVLTTELLNTINEVFTLDGTVVVTVDGEEDLATLPVIVAAPDAASIVYGQPDEGMVLAIVDDALRAHCWELLHKMDGDLEQLSTLLAS